MLSRMASTASCVERSRSVSSMRRMKYAARGARKGPGVQRRADVAEMDEARGRRSEAGTDCVTVVLIKSESRPRASRSFRSSMSSRPTATRIRPWVMPAAWRCASVSRPCEVLAGWVMVVLVSPRLAVIEHTRVLSITWNALRRAARPAACWPLTMNDTTAPPQPACWRMASACCGCDASPGWNTRSTCGCFSSHCASCSASRTAPACGSTASPAP